MAEQNRPASAQQAPDPASSYERANPQKEAGTGRLDNNNATPTAAPDRQNDAVANRQDPTRQINGEDIPNQRGSATPAQPDHSMNEEEPDGWDLAPTDIKDPRHKRHPRTDGKGGTP
jgi:hypothetical protein